MQLILLKIFCVLGFMAIAEAQVHPANVLELGAMVRRNAAETQKPVIQTQNPATNSYESENKTQEPVTVSQKPVSDAQESKNQTQKTSQYDDSCTKGNNKGKQCVLIQNCPELYEKSKIIQIDDPLAIVPEFGHSFEENKMWQEVENATCKLLKTEEEEFYYKFIRYVCCHKKTEETTTETPQPTTEVQKPVTETNEPVTESQEPLTTPQVPVTEAQEPLNSTQGPFKLDVNCTSRDNIGKQCVLIQNCPQLYEKAKIIQIDDPLAVVPQFGISLEESKMWQEVEYATCGLLKTDEEEFYYNLIRYVCCAQEDQKPDVTEAHEPTSIDPTTEVQKPVTETNKPSATTQQPVTVSQVPSTEVQESENPIQEPSQYDVNCSKGNNRGRICVLIQNCPDLYEKSKALRVDEPVAIVPLFGYSSDEMKMLQEVEQATCGLLKTEEKEHNYNFIRYVCCSMGGLESKLVFS